MLYAILSPFGYIIASIAANTIAGRSRTHSTGKLGGRTTVGLDRIGAKIYKPSAALDR